MKKLILSTILLALPLLACAYDCQVDGIYYNLVPGGNVAEVTYRNYDASNNSYSSDYSGSIIIPEKFTYEDMEYSVTRVGDNAFRSCNSLTSVTIPNSVTSIGVNAFWYCEGLKSVNMGNSVTSIESSAFRHCSKLTSVTLPNSVTYIGLYVFSSVSTLKLTSVISKMDNPCTIPENCFISQTYSDAILYVPIGTKEKYKSTNYWNKFKHIEEGNPKEHMLTYFVDGNKYVSYLLDEGELISPETVPKKEGYTFFCWSEIPTTMPAYDLSISGTFTKNKYKLTYTVDGEDYKFLEIEFGSSITAEDNPTKEGFTFSGWSEIPETMPANDVTITGSFTINKYKLTYMVDGVEYKSSEIEYNSAINPEEPPTKEGYTFSGWSEIPETMPASDVTITGTFTVNKYKLTYIVDGEDFMSSNVNYGTAITPEEAPVKEGYTFSGWSEIPETMPASDVTITGTFTVNKYKLIYTVDGEEYKSSEIEFGSSITVEANPTKEGYTFSGWSEIPTTMPANDVTVTGTFSVNKYIITYMVDNAVLTTEEVAYGSTIAPPKSQKDGYDILWSFYPTTMPAYNITINGIYTTGIVNTAQEESKRQVFTPDGKRVKTPQKGLNIIRTSDGKIKKVVVK